MISFKNTVLIDDNPNWERLLMNSEIEFICTKGLCVDDVIAEYLNKHTGKVPVISASLKYSENEKRIDYLGLKLLDALSIDYGGDVIVLSFEKGKKLLRKEYSFLIDSSDVYITTFGNLINHLT
jgi:hypothetical protein